jgi:putative ABC transport system permease protein
MLRQNVAYAFRSLRKDPGFSLLAVTTLALGVGAATAIFSILDSVLLRPLPFPEPSRLVELYESGRPNDVAGAERVSPADFLDWNEQAHTFSAIAASCGFNYTLTGRRDPQSLSGVATTASAFSVLGVRPQLGRAFTAEEDSYAAPHVVMLSDHLWRESLQADRNIVGKAVSLNSDSYTVVGVMPADFDFLDSRPDLWIPLRQQIRPDRMTWRSARFLQVVGRLRPGVTLDQARAEMNLIAANIKQTHSADDLKSSVILLPLHQALIGDRQPVLLLTMGVVAVVLLIACVNVANLLLVRVSRRQRELAVRMAIGAGWAEVLAQPLLEGILLGLGAGALGLLFAVSGKSLLMAVLPAHAEEFRPIELNPVVLGFSLLVSLLTGILSGMVPALTLLRSDLRSVLQKAGSATTANLESRRWLHGLAVAEIAASVILLIGSALLLRSFVALGQTPLGFRTDHAVAMQIAPPRIRYQEDSAEVALYRQAMERARGISGVEAAGMTNQLPLRGDYGGSFIIPGKTSDTPPYESASVRTIDSGYLSVMEIPLLAGRNFRDADIASSHPLAMISESMAHRYWPNENAVGKSLMISIPGVDPGPREIVGIVGDVRDEIGTDPHQTIYVPYPQAARHSMELVLRTGRPIGAVAAAVRQAVQSIDPDQPVTWIQTLDDLVANAREPWKFSFVLMSLLAASALGLTLVGLFGVISYMVRERTKEIGIRIAVGANRSNIIAMVLAKAAQLTLWGISIGIVGSMFLTRFLSQLLYGVPPQDPFAFAGAALLLAMATILASYIPAWRAARIDPLVALREE